jgi:hypothetical protein
MRPQAAGRGLVRSGLFGGVAGLLVFLAVDFLFAPALPPSSRALLGVVLALGVSDPRVGARDPRPRRRTPVRNPSDSGENGRWPQLWL